MKHIKKTNSIENKKKVNSEVAGFKNTVGSLLFTDTIYDEANTQMEGKFNAEVYDKILRDDQVSAGLMQRISSVVGNKYIVEKGGDSKEDISCAEFIVEQMEHIKWNSVTAQMLYSIFYGWTPAENLFNTDGRFIYLDKVKVRDRANFEFNAKEQMVFSPQHQDKKIICKAPYFWHTVFNPTNSNELYGRGLANPLYYPVLFKHAGVQHWNDFLEASANPKIIGKVDDYAQDTEKEKLINTIEAIKGAGGAVLPKNQELTVLESTRDGKEFDNFVDFQNRSISKTILGQSLTIEDGTSRSFGKTLLEIRQERAKQDALMVDAPFNEVVVKFLAQTNFPNAKIPILRRDLEIKEDIESRSRADVRIFSTGARPTQEYLDETYGVGWVLPPAIAEPHKITVDNRIVSHANGEVSVAKEGEKQGNFSENQDTNQDLVDETSHDLTKELNNAIDGKVARVMDFIDRNGISKTIQVLPEILPDEEFDDVMDLIEQAQLRASAIGMS